MRPAPVAGASRGPASATGAARVGWRPAISILTSIGGGATVTPPSATTIVIVAGFTPPRPLYGIVPDFAILAGNGEWSVPATRANVIGHDEYIRCTDPANAFIQRVLASR